VKVVLFGAGGHGRVVADILAALAEVEVIGFLDDDPGRHGQVVGALPVLGGTGRLAALRTSGVTGGIVTIGANRVRAQRARQLAEAGLDLIRAIHPSAVVAPGAIVGAGTVVMAGAVINTGTRVGRNVIINTGATVDHDCVVGDAVHISPGANVAGNVDVADETHLGIGCCVIPGIRIGAGSTIGAGAVVVRDVPANETWAGNPARKIDRARTGDWGDVHGSP
jgi:sugar O-acyltransferase (sialic acid O-acetyltransferase NeuD family)